MSVHVQGAIPNHLLELFMDGQRVITILKQTSDPDIHIVLVF